MSNKAAKKQRPEAKEVPLNFRTCATCHRDISDEIYVKCGRCLGFNQCLECFSVGAEAENHLKTHPFILLEPFLQPIFQEKWTSEEEITLLNAIQTCGVGNWHEIAAIIKTKSAIECEVHYFNSFIDSPNAPLPEDTILPPTELPPPPDFDTSPRESRPSISHEKNLAERNKKEKTTPAEFAGWMPRRCEFEVEYLNDAEQLVAGVSFSETEDTQQTLEQKLIQLRTYNEQLEARHIRTHFAMDYGMLDQEVKSFGGRTKAEKEVEETLLPLTQITSCKNFTTMIHTIQKEMRLKNEVDLRIKWRQNGIVSPDEGLIFNDLQNLLNEDKLTPSEVEKWNRRVKHLTESPEFKAKLDRQLLSKEENKLCQTLSISPHKYIQIKDILIRESSARGKMTPEIALSLIQPPQEHIIIPIYETMKKIGLFITVDDFTHMKAAESQNQNQDE